MEQQENIKVVVRCRPISENELKIDGTHSIKITSNNTIVVQKNDRYCFTFDSIFDENCSQEMLFKNIVKPLVTSVLNGFNGCIFAYGQTSTGKTYTMEGNINDINDKGIIPRVFDEIYSTINMTNNYKDSVSASYIEVYNENLRDLLSNQNNNEIKMFEVNDINIIPNLRIELCHCVNDLNRLLIMGNQQRIVSKTNMNEYSSRSHAIFSIKIERHNSETNNYTVGKLNLVDLAGCERISKSGVINKEFKESTKINSALLALGNVIVSLSEGSYASFRESKLTRLLQDSLGGNSKTIMIATISPAKYNVDETLSTLRFAERVKTIKNKPIINEDNDNNQIKEFKNEIERLKKLIEEKKKRISNKDLKSLEISMENLLDCTEIKRDHNSYCNYNNKSDKKFDLNCYSNCKNDTFSNSNKHLLDSVNETQIVIEKNFEEITKRKKNEYELKEKLQIEDANNLAKKQTCEGLNSEAEELIESLENALQCYTQLDKRIKNINETHKNRRNEFAKLETIIIKKYKLKELIIKNFIPCDERELIENFNNRIYDSNYIHSFGNILQLNLDTYSTSVSTYTNPKVPPCIREVIDLHFQLDQSLTILEPVVRSYRSKSTSRLYKNLQR